MKHVIETVRLTMRFMESSDLSELKKILGDPVAMKAYEHAFSDEESEIWLNKQLGNYREYGFGLFAVVLKATGEFIGQCGLTWQLIEGERLLEIGYLFNRNFWHNGYAAEAAKAAKDYAFNVLEADEVFSIIRDSNIASMNVAIRNGMTIKKIVLKHYWGVDMPHYVFSVKKS